MTTIVTTGLTALWVGGLRVEGLRVGTATGDLVHGVDFSLDRGQCLGIVGESGSGKTLTAMAVAGLLPPGVRTTGGRIELGGHDVTGRDAATRRRLLRHDFGIVFQNPTVSLNPRLTIGTQLREALPDDVRADRAAAHRRGLELLERVGVNRAAERLRSYPHELSGGLNQRVVIAMAIARSPRVLIADEATTALDVSVQRQVLDFIDEWRRSGDHSVILVSHDIGVIADRADQMLVLQGGRTVERGTVHSVLRTPAAPYTRELLAAVPRLDEPAPAALGAPSGEPAVLLRADGLVREFAAAGHRVHRLRAVDRVDLRLHQGQALGIVGESGSGKTTLARILVGLDAGYTGELSAFGDRVTRSHRLSRRRAQLRDVQFVFQDPYAALDPRQTVAEIIGEPIEVAGSPEQRRRRRIIISELLDDVRLPQGFAQRRPHQLSGGQRQRVVIARALALRPRILVADEPVSSLDLSVQRRILDLLIRLRAGHDLSYVVISHDLGVIKRLCTDVAVMREGRIVEQGPTDQIFAEPGDPYTRLLLAAIPGGTWRGTTGSDPRTTTSKASTP